MRPTSAIFLGGLIGGTIDITYAIVFFHFRGVSPTRIFQSVASGLLGLAAYQGGSGTAALGLLLHFVVALIWAGLFVGASLRMPALARQAVWTGPVFGFLIYAVMYLVVLPLSAYPHPIVFQLPATSTGIAVHMFGVGLPIALCARRALRTNSSAAL